MADAEQSFIENNEEQSFQIQESNNNLVVNEFDQQNIAGIVPEDYAFAVSETGNQGLSINEQSFAGNELENNFGVIAEQTFTENENENEHEHEHEIEHENEHNLEVEDTVNGLDESHLKQELTEIEVNGTDDVPNDSQIDKKNGPENNTAGSGEKKWPGWPGESVFRMLVPAQKVGNIIGRKGEYIKKTVEETRARIKVLDGPPGSRERAVRLAYFKATVQSPMPSLI